MYSELLLIPLQLFLLEGISYEQKESEVGFENLTEEDFEAMALLTNALSKDEPLLVPGKGQLGEHDANNKLLVPCEACLSPPRADSLGKIRQLLPYKYLLQVQL